MTPHLYRVVSWPSTNVLVSHLYQAEPPISTNVRHLYRLGWIRPRRVSVRGHLYRLVAPTGTNAIIYTGEKNTRYKWKIRTGIYVRFSSSEPTNVPQANIRHTKLLHQHLHNKLAGLHTTLLETEISLCVAIPTGKQIIDREMQN
jgi:hypothetical protein